jgi:hypothetical protein
MVYDIQNHWLYPLFGILNTRKKTMFQKRNLVVFPFPLTQNIVFFYSIQNSRQCLKCRNPVTPSAIHHGQSPLESEENKITRELKELVLTRTATNQDTAWAPTELPIAREKNNWSTVLTEMSAGYAGGLEVSTADQYSQDPRFKTNPLH